MHEPPSFPEEHWKERLLDPENAVWLERALGWLPPRHLVDVFQLQFKKGDKSALLLVGKLRNFAAEDILANLEKIREREPKVLEALVDFWLKVINNYLDIEGMTEGTSTLLTVIAWLWSESPDAPAPSWEFIKTLATRCKSMEHDLDNALHRVREAERAAEKATKQLGRQSGKVERENDKLKSLNERIAEQQQHLKSQKKQIEELNGDVRAAKDKVAELNEVVAQRGATIEWHKTTHAKQQEALRLDVNHLRKERDDLTAMVTQLRKDLDEARSLNDALKQKNADLNIDIEELRKRANVVEIPLDAKELQNSLIIDYEQLGETAIGRLNSLITLYEAVLVDNEAEVLVTHTNWLDLDGGAVDGILLLGLEPLLLDLTNLPIRRYLAMQSFKRESVLRSLVTHLDSPRLTVSTDG